MLPQFNEFALVIDQTYTGHRTDSHHYYGRMQTDCVCRYRFNVCVCVVCIPAYEYIHPPNRIREAHHGASSIFFSPQQGCEHSKMYFIVGQEQTRL